MGENTGSARDSPTEKERFGFDGLRMREWVLGDFPSFNLLYTTSKLNKFTL